MWSDPIEGLANCIANGFDGSLCRFSQPVLELGEELFDWVEIWRVFGQKEELRTGFANGAPNSLAFVRAEIVHHNDVARLEGGHENLLDIEEEPLAVDRPVDEPRRFDAIMAQRSQEGHGLPVAMRHFGLDPLSDRRPAHERSHVGLGPGLVDEHQAGRIDPVLIQNPLRPSARNIGTILLAGDQRLFL